METETFPKFVPSSTPPSMNTIVCALVTLLKFTVTDPLFTLKLSIIPVPERVASLMMTLLGEVDDNLINAGRATDAGLDSWCAGRRCRLRRRSKSVSPGCGRQWYISPRDLFESRSDRADPSIPVLPLFHPVKSCESQSTRSAITNAATGNA